MIGLVIDEAAERAAALRAALAARVVIADGAMGTMLHARTAPHTLAGHRCYDEMNLSLPAIVRDVHQAYVRAGAEIVEYAAELRHDKHEKENQHAGGGK